MSDSETVLGDNDMWEWKRKQDTQWTELDPMAPLVNGVLLRGLVEERDEPAIGPEFDIVGSRVGEPVNTLPEWAESKHAHQAMLYRIADSCEFKHGDVVWCKLTGAGPFVVLAPSVDAPGSVSMSRGHDSRVTYALPGEITTTPPDPPPSRLVPVLWALYFACIAYVAATAWGAL